MLEHWKIVKLGDLCDITMGQSPKSSFYNSEKEGMPFLQGNRTFGDKYPTFDTYTSFVTKEASEGDVIMSVRAPVGDVNITPLDMCLGRGVCGLRHKENAQEYLYYLMRYSKESLLNRENGTVFGSVNRADIINLEVKVPPLEQQIEIGKTLAAIDEKIENNKKINHHLEQIAMAIFDDIFPNVSSGNSKIGKYIVPKRGKGLLSKDAIDGVVPVIAGGLQPATYHNVANTMAPVITISASGANAGYINLWSVPVWSSDSSFIDKSMTNDVYFWYIMLKKRQQEIYDSQTGSAQPHIYPKHIDAMPTIALSDELISSFTEQVTSMFEQIGNNLDEIKVLQDCRDALLPKLMSGELSVTD